MGMLSNYAEDVENIIYRAANIFIRKSDTAGEASPTSDFINLGHIQGASVDWDAVTTDKSSNGRNVELALDMVISVELRQTSNTELAEIENLTHKLVDVLITQSPESDDVIEADVSTKAVNGFLVYKVLANTEGSINFMGDASIITLNIPFRLQKRDLADDIPQETE